MNQKSSPSVSSPSPSVSSPTVLDGPLSASLADSTRSAKPLLANRVVLVAGCDAAFGRALALAFAKAGADVAMVYHRQHLEVEATQHQIEVQGRLCWVTPADLGEEVLCLQAVAEAVRELGQLDIVINFSTPPQQTQTLNVEALEQHYRSRILSGLFLTKAAVPRLKPGGVIVNIADGGSNGAAEGRHISNTIMALTRALAASLSQHQIRVYGVNPSSSKDAGDSEAAICARSEQLMYSLLGLLVPNAAELARPLSKMNGWRINL